MRDLVSVASAATAATAATTTTTAITTTTVATTTTTIATTTATILTRTRLIDDKVPVQESLPVQSFDRCLTFSLRGHLNKCETPRTPGELVRHDVDRLDFTKRGKRLVQILLGRLVRKIAYVDPHSYVLLLRFRNHPALCVCASLCRHRLLPLALNVLRPYSLLPSLAAACGTALGLIGEALLCEELLL